MSATDRYLRQPAVDPSGLQDPDSLAYPLPYNLRPKDAIRMVEDLYELLHDLNSQLDSKGYDRLEELLDAAGFSGLISRAVCDGLAKFSRELVTNRYPGGYPDLLPKGVYPRDKVQRSEKGGLEVKASRQESSWQSHSPRGGWFCVVQFAIDRDEDKAIRDREPTTVQAVMIAPLAEKDWSWQPAGEGKKRTGTASIVPSGRSRLRSNAVWVDPIYADRHQERVFAERKLTFSKEATDRVLAVLRGVGAPMTAMAVAEALSESVGLPPEALKSKVGSVLSGLAKSRYAIRTRPGIYTSLGS